MKVYQAINAVQRALAAEGISKSRRNAAQGYNFRGIDEVYAALSPLLAAHGLVIVPRVLSRECLEGQTRKGDPLFRVTVHAEFDFISADDGSKHTASTFGEAMDSADKATNKAMSAAYKYAAFMTFAIPTEGDNDADAHTPEVGGREGQSEGRAVNPPAEMPDSEWAELVNWAKAAGVTSKKLCDTYQVQNLRTLDQAQYTDAIQRLKDQVAAKAKAETNAKQPDFAGVDASEVPF